MDTYLTPIESPSGIFMKLAYYFTRREFGKVLTPLKVFSARLPASFGLFYTKVQRLDKRLTLPPETVLLMPYPPSGAPPPFARAGGAYKCLSFLYRHCPHIHQKKIKKPGKFRSVESIPDEHSLSQTQTRRIELCDGPHQEKKVYPAPLSPP